MKITITEVHNNWYEARPNGAPPSISGEGRSPRLAIADLVSHFPNSCDLEIEYAWIPSDIDLVPQL